MGLVITAVDGMNVNGDINIPIAIQVSDEVHICGNCKWHDKETGVCRNGYSEYVSKIRKWAYECELWELANEYSNGEEN